MVTHYDILEVPAGADSEAIRKAYRAALKKYHPDLHEGDPAAELYSKRIIDAYNVLKDPDRRAIYDEQLTCHAQQKRRLFLITLLVSAGLACGGSFAVLWVSQVPPSETIVAAPPSPQRADRPDIAGVKAARDAKPEAPSVARLQTPARSESAPAPEPAARPSSSGDTASEHVASNKVATASEPPAPADTPAVEPQPVAEDAAAPGPASAPRHPARAESARVAAAQGISVTPHRHAAPAPPEWIVKAGEAHSSAIAPPPIAKAEEPSPSNPEPAAAGPASAPNRIAPAEPFSPAPAPAMHPELSLPPPGVAALEPQTRAAPDVAAAPPVSPLPTPPQEVTWADIEKSRDLKIVWEYIEGAPSMYHAVLAARRLDELIETTDNVVGLEALRIVADSTIAEKVQKRLNILTRPKDMVTGTITEPSEALSAQVAPAPGSSAASSLPAEETRADPATTAQPREAEKHIKSGLAALKKGNSDKALAAFDTAVRLDASNARALLHRAAAWESKGNPDQALADYNAAISLDPADAAALQGRGLLWGRRGDFDQALFDIERAVRMNFANAKAYRDRGIIWLEMGRYNRAITDFSRAIAIDPDLASAYVGRGQAFLKKGDTITASVNFDKAARRDESAAKAYRELMKTQLKKDASVQQDVPSPR